MVALNDDGKVVHEIAKKVWCSSVLAREAQVVLVAITLASTLDFCYM